MNTHPATSFRAIATCSLQGAVDKTTNRTSSLRTGTTRHTHPAESRHISEEDLIQMLTLAQENGVGADRSQGHGMFDVVEFCKVDEAGTTDKKPSPRKRNHSSDAQVDATV